LQALCEYHVGWNSNNDILCSQIRQSNSRFI